MNKMGNLLMRCKWLLLIALAACSGISQGGDGAGGAGGLGEASGGAAGSAGRVGAAGASGSHVAGAGGSADRPVASAGEAGVTSAEAGQAGESGAGGEAGAPVAPPAPIVKLLIPGVLLAKDFPFSPVICTNVGHFSAKLSIGGAGVSDVDLVPAKPSMAGPCAIPMFGFQYVTPVFDAGMKDGAVGFQVRMYNSLPSGDVLVSSDLIMDVLIDRTVPVPSAMLYDGNHAPMSCVDGLNHQGPFSVTVMVDSPVSSLQLILGRSIDAQSQITDPVKTTIARDVSVPIALTTGTNWIDVSASDAAGNIGHLARVDAEPCFVNVN